MNVGGLVNLQGQMFLLIIVGMIMKKKGLMPEASKTILTDLLLCFLMPCNIINSFRVEFSLEILKKFGVVLAIATVIQIISYILSRFLYNNREESVKKVLQYATIVSNSGFLGLPVIDGVFGADGLMYASIFIVPMRIMMWTAGITCFTGESDKKAAIKKVILHPCIVAVYIGLLFMLTQWEPPTIIDNTLRGASGCVTTVSMIVIGIILADVDFKTMVNKNVLLCSIIRLGVLPAAALLICRILNTDQLLTGVAVLITAMPAGSTTAMLAAKYNGDYILGTKCVVCTTILSLLTITLWCMVI